MICISIAAQTREFALVDMFNAGPQCDMLEVRLDRFYREPNLAELLAAKKTRPVIMTCRRADDGGDWQGSEEERIARLKQCVALKADYVEVEWELADQFPPSPPTKRIFAYTNLLEVPDNLASIHAQIAALKPDVIKLAMPTRTPEDAWPLVQVLGKSSVPTVVLGLGEAGVMLTLLARKIQAPWAYAALEKGMESYYGQTSIRELLEIYRYADIDRSTRFVGVAGFEEEQHAQVELLNTAFAHAKQPLRCLPIGVGEIPLFRKIGDAVKLTSVIVGEKHQAELRALATKLDPMAEQAGVADFLVPQGDQWQGFQLRARSALAFLDAGLRAKHPEGPAFQGRTIVVIGTGGLARPVVSFVKQHGGKPVLACFSLEASQYIADEMGCQLIDLDSLGSTPYDALVACEKVDLTGTTFRKGSIVIDLAAPLSGSKLLADAHSQGCTILRPQQLMVDEVIRAVKALTSQEVPREPLLALLANR